MSVGVNVLVSMGTMFCVGFYAGGTEAEPHGARVRSYLRLAAPENHVFQLPS